jgi:uncharacterized protein
MAHFELYQDAKKEWRWRFVATNGRIIAATSEGYRTDTDCINGIRILQEEGPKSPINKI